MEGKRAPKGTRTSLSGLCSLVAVSVLIKIARLVTGVVVMLAGNLGYRLVAMSVLIDIAGLVTRVVVMLAGRFLARLVTMPVFVEIIRSMAGMVVMLAGFFVWHCRSPFRGALETAGLAPLFPCD